DENLPDSAAMLLRTAGHDVTTTLEEKLGGAADPRSPKCAEVRNGHSSHSTAGSGTSGPIHPLTTTVSWCCARANRASMRFSHWSKLSLRFWKLIHSSVRSGSSTNVASGSDSET